VTFVASRGPGRRPNARGDGQRDESALRTRRLRSTHDHLAVTRRVRLPRRGYAQDVLNLQGERDVTEAQRDELAGDVGLEDREAVVRRAKAHPAMRTWPAKSSGV
jgi:hypothetical protein